MNPQTSTLCQFRPVFGFIFAALFPGLLFATPFLLAGDWRMGWSIVVIGLKATVPPVLLIVLPLYLWLKSTGRLSLIWAVVAGGAAGTALALWIAVRRFWLFGDGKRFGQLWHDYVRLEEPQVFILFGFVCGLVGWLAAYGFRLKPRQSC